MSVRLVVSGIICGLLGVSQVQATEAAPEGTIGGEPVEVVEAAEATEAAVEATEAAAEATEAAVEATDAAAEATEAEQPGAQEMQSPYGEQTDVEQRIRAYRELYDNRKLEQLKRREEARKRFEARRKAYAERLEAMLQQREDEQSGIIRQQERMRDNIVDERDYLSKHHQELLDMAMKRKEEQIARHEEMLKQAEERRARYEKYRQEIETLGPDEWEAYIEEHRKELFADMEDEEMPRFGPRPPWMAGPPRAANIPQPVQPGNAPQAPQ